jgi:hypothetical protein
MPVQYIAMWIMESLWLGICYDPMRFIMKPLGPAGDQQKSVGYDPMRFIMKPLGPVGDQQ